MKFGDCLAQQVSNRSIVCATSKETRFSSVFDVSGRHDKSEAGRHQAVDHQEDHRAAEHGRRRGGRVRQQPARREGKRLLVYVS